MNDNEYKHYTWGAVIQTVIVFGFLAFCVHRCSGQQYHELPPPINIVGAGYNLEFASNQKKASVWTLGLGAFGTGLLFAMDDTRHTAAPWVVAGMTVGVSMTFSLSGLKWQGRSADLWKCGYSPVTLYESIPDSLGDDPPKRYLVPNMIDGTPIKLPARMYTK